MSDRCGRGGGSQIIPYGTMAAKAVVRDVGRVLGHPFGFVDRIAKLIPNELDITLEKALEKEPELARLHPRTLSALSEISGIGARKREAYGKAFLDVICGFADMKE